MTLFSFWLGVFRGQGCTRPAARDKLFFLRAPRETRRGNTALRVGHIISGAESRPATLHTPSDLAELIPAAPNTPPDLAQSTPAARNTPLD
ncbi:MAG: hypothetical protein M3Y80_06085, partial [Verrucomicrobiota bacterium]|nr:hypothetical protein [Verrucomicrobiota bacterium]